jgi:hypothetical protein
MLFEHARAKGDGPPPLAARPLFVAELPLEGPATIAGIPIADSLLEQWRANADIEPHFVDPDGKTIVIGRRASLLTAKLARAIWLRDQQCQCGMCDRRYGLQIHHLRPRSWGGTDDPANMALVCARGPDAHHPMLIPHGPYALIGNPSLVGGLRMVHVNDLTEDEADQIGLPDEFRKRRRRRPPDEPRAVPRAA